MRYDDHTIGSHRSNTRPAKSKSHARVLVIEPNEVEASDLVRELRRHGHEAHSVTTAADALEAHDGADLIVLEPNLPDIDGLEVCRAIRTECDVPIIVVSGRVAAADRVLALHAGADDYLTKPYWFPELLARITTVMRRVRQALVSPQRRRIERGPLRIDLLRRELHLRGRKIELTRKEFDLLSLLAIEPRVVVSRHDIAAKVWNGTCSARSRTIDTHVSNLRAKLGEETSIVAERGIGFRLNVFAGGHGAEQQEAHTEDTCPYCRTKLA